MISTKFAYLPNCIIREIIAYTGAKYKKRNGKYMGQIPKNDPRFTLLSNIPKKHIDIHVNDGYTYSSSKVILLKDDRYDIYTIELHVTGIIYKNNQSKLRKGNPTTNDSMNTPIYTSYFIVDDGNNNTRRQYSYCEEKRTEPQSGLRRFLDSLSRIFYENPTINEKSEEKLSTKLNKWMVIVDILWWISFGYLTISVISMFRRYKFS